MIDAEGRADLPGFITKRSHELSVLIRTCLARVDDYLLDASIPDSLPGHLRIHASNESCRLGIVETD